MIWLVWRRQRVALLLAIGLAALVTVVTGVGRYVAVGIGRDQGLLPCLRGVLTAPCGTPQWYDYYGGVSSAMSFTQMAMIVLPTVCGIVAGAGLFGRELERGTHVFALSQSTSRLRWWATGLLVTGLPVAAAVAVASVVAALALRPFGNLVFSSFLDLSTFLTTGLLPGAYTLLAFGLAAAAGLVLRNALAAVAVAVAVQLLVVGVLGFGVRNVYLPPEVVVAPVAAADEPVGPLFDIPSTALQLGTDYLDAQGRVVDPRQIFRAPGCPGSGTLGDCLRTNGVTALALRYQPESRYWPFQAIETGILLALLAGTLGVGLWGLRRRVH